MVSDRDSEKEARDKLLTDYNAIIRESSLLVTFTGILFGFLLNISVAYTDKIVPLNRVVITLAILSMTVAISLFIMPVIYHHLEYPYRDLEKFKRRAHRFMLFGFLPTGLTLYLSLEIALYSFIGLFSFALAAIPFAFAYALFLNRR